MSDGQELQKYSAGERIALSVELHDDTGIYDVKGFFVHSEDPKAHVTLPGYGGGAQEATVYIQNVITTNTLPGQYVCQYIEAQDGRGNYNVLRPDLSFYVEPQAALVDDQGPELKGWHFASEEIEVVEMSVIEAEKGDVEQYANRRQPAEIASGMAEDTGEQEDMQGGTPEDEWVDTHQFVQNKIDERISGMTEDTEAGADIDLHIERRISGMTEETGSGADIGAHIESRMDEIAHDVTEETGAEGDPHLHVQRRMEEMAKDMFEDD
jgi:hypothetical protein